MNQGWLPSALAPEHETFLVAWEGTAHICRAYRDGERWIGLIPAQEVRLYGEKREFEQAPTHFRRDIEPPPP
jgi:hypothetical protein